MQSHLYHVHVPTARVQESKYGHVRTYGRGLERLLVHTYGQGLCTWRGSDGVLFIGSQPAGSERRNCVVVFIERQRNTCCSSGANRLGRNSQPKRGMAYWMETQIETRPGVPQNGGNGL